jgi:hypothetical protein
MSESLNLNDNVKASLQSVNIASSVSKIQAILVLHSFIKIFQGVTSPWDLSINNIYVVKHGVKAT